MKNNLTSLIGLGLLLAAAGGLYWFLAHSPASVEEEEAAIESVVPVQVGTIERRTLHGYAVVYGRVEPTPPDANHAGAHPWLQSAVDGVVTRVACGPGQHVRAGDVLFELDHRHIDAEIQQQQQARDYAQREFDRQQQLLQIEGTSEKAVQQAARDLQQAEQALNALEVTRAYHTLRAPVSGIVTDVGVTRGRVVQAGQKLAEILDPTQRVLSLRIPVGIEKHIQLQQTVEITLEKSRAEQPPWEAVGRVDYLAPEIDPRDGTRLARVTLKDDRPETIGQLVQARIVHDTHPDCLAVPATALVTDPEGRTTIAIIQNRVAHQVPVQAGLREADWIEVVGDGLRAGLTIATEGAYGLPEETKVTLIEQDVPAGS